MTHIKITGGLPLREGWGIEGHGGGICFGIDGTSL